MILFNWTEQGIRTVREAGPRLDGLKRTLRVERSSPYCERMQKIAGNFECQHLTTLAPKVARGERKRP
jgi:hypothetical protein